MICGVSILKFLGKKLFEDDPQASSHWKHYHKFLEIDNELNVIRTVGFGDGKTRNKHIADWIHYIFQIPYVLPNFRSKEFSYIYQVAKQNARRIKIRFSLDILRQVLTLSYLKRNKLLTQYEIGIVIGDGFGSLTSLLLRAKICRKVVMVNLTKTLFVDVDSVLKFPEFLDNCSSVIVNTKQEMANAIQDPNVKIIALEAKNSELLSFSKAELAFNIASMQEMDMSNIEGYFRQFRKLACQRQFFFYCCNREKKLLPDGSQICFEKYPWLPGDKHLLDQPCPWHQYYYSKLPPFYKKYDGPIRHRFTVIEGKNKNV